MPQSPNRKTEYRRSWMTKWRKENPELARAKAKAFYDKKIEEAKVDRLIPKGPWASAKSGAYKRNLTWNIIREDFLIPDVCPVLGIPLDWSSYDNTPSLDRINNNRGYEKDNVIIVSRRVNRIKSAATITELKRIGDFYASK